MDDTQEWTVVRVLAKTTSNPKSLIYDIDNNSVIVGLEEGKMISINIADSSLSPFLPAHPSSVIRLSKHPNQPLLVSELKIYYHNENLITKM